MESRLVIKLVFTRFMVVMDILATPFFKIYIGYYSRLILVWQQLFYCFKRNSRFPENIADAVDVCGNIALPGGQGYDKMLSLMGQTSEHVPQRVQIIAVPLLPVHFIPQFIEKLLLFSAAGEVQLHRFS